jgi:GH25 family lysozyme M1 (1,4-beta-N-acetylmuramidase)
VLGLALVSCVGFASGLNGFDISADTCDGSSWVSSTQFPCFKSKGKSFTVIQAWHGGHGMASAISYCAAQANSAGLDVSLYAYACPKCSGNNPAYSVFYNMTKTLASKGVKYRYLYFDVEECPPSQCWYSDPKQNAQFLSDAIAGATAAGAKCAIYANWNDWSALMGTNSSFSHYPLWYPHYDGVASFADFKPFGGWTTPHMKQYGDASDVGCYSNVDVNWAPSL